MLKSIIYVASVTSVSVVALGSTAFAAQRAVPVAQAAAANSQLDGWGRRKTDVPADPSVRFGQLPNWKKAIVKLQPESKIEFF